MSTNPCRMGTLAVALVGACVSGTARAAEPVAAATPWVEAQAARVRLVAGADAARAGKSFLAGVEIVMAQGWKTYWRNPGDSGVPPSWVSRSPTGRGVPPWQPSSPTRGQAGAWSQTSTTTSSPSPPCLRTS